MKLLIIASLCSIIISLASAAAAEAAPTVCTATECDPPLDGNSFYLNMNLHTAGYNKAEVMVGNDTM